MITEQEAKHLLESARDEMKMLGWDGQERIAGIIWLTFLVKTLYDSPLPMNHKKFPDLLRIMANILQVISDKNN